MRRYIFSFLATMMAQPLAAEAVTGELSGMIRKEEAVLAKLSRARVDALFRRVSAGQAGSVQYTRNFLDSLPAAKGGKPLNCL
ncbi:MAG: cell wall hydrolase, partial [Planktotalea arctica]